MHLPKFVYIPLILLTGFVLMSSSVFAQQVTVRVFFGSSFTDMEYQQRIIQRLNANWRSSGELPDVGTKAVFVIKCDRNGSAIFNRILRSSGSAAFDKDADDCLRRSIPFEPLPQSYPEPYLEMQFHFIVEN